MKTLTIVFDGGTSSSKVIAAYPAHDSKSVFEDEGYYLIDSGVRQLTKQTYNDKLSHLDKNIALNGSLVSFEDPKSEQMVYWEIGESVSRKGLLFVSDRKFETLIVKLLAFIGYLSQNYSSKETIELNLGILLPLDEIEDRQTLGKWLRQIISEPGFRVNGRSFGNISINKINVKPEGYGIYKNSQAQRVGVLMLGHSDCSWLIFSNGSWLKDFSRTLPGAGMHDLIENLRFPVSRELKMAKIINEAGEECNPEVLIELTQTKTQDEIEQLVKAVRSARLQYWSDRTRDLNSLRVNLASSVCVAGGAAYYFSKEIKNLFKERKIKIDWGKSLKKEFCHRFEIKTSDKTANLFLDCYGYFKFITEVRKVVPTVEKPLLKVIDNAV